MTSTAVFTRLMLVFLLPLVAASAIAQPGLDTRPSNTTCLATGTWANLDIGAAAPAGDFSSNGTTLTVRGAGADIWNQNDAFHFAYQTLSGDGEIVARIASFTNTDPWAKAGVMVREALTSNSRFAMMLMTPGANGAAFHYRTATGGNAQPPSSGDGTSRLPRWVRIVRQGNTVTGYHSTDGLSWVQRDSIGMVLPQTVYVGLAVTSHNNGTLATATFDNVGVSADDDDTGASLQVDVVDAFPTTPSFSQPTKLLQAPGDASRWYVLEKTGRVRVFNVSSPTQVSTWLDFTSKVRTASEGGLLGLAFHPDFPRTPHVFVSYTAPGSATPMRSVISRMVLDDTVTPQAPVEQVLLTIDQPYDNHNGGEIAFGPDGYLYIAVGDGGSGSDPHNYGQNTARMLGKFLRIEVWNVGWPTPGYLIPPSNPFAGNPKCGAGANGAACPEIFAWGFRNPWRFSFDAETGALWTGDVGQNTREEVDIVNLGGNYGWRCREGSVNHNTAGCAGGYTGPVFDYSHQNGDRSITGGFVYRGGAIPGLRGRYVYGDYVSGRIWALRAEGAGSYATDLLADTTAGISSFGTGADGELYFADLNSGRLHRLVAGGSGSGASTGMPDDLAATGCVDPHDPRQPAAGVIPYRVNFAFWSDGAAKQRYLAIPDGSRITINASGDWELPVGSVLVKTMQLGGRNIETRLLMREQNGTWAGYTYEWNEAGTAATRVHGGKTKSVQGVDWVYPAEGQCQECHTVAAGFTLGLENDQLNGPLQYPATGRTANQIETLAHIGMFAAHPGDPAGLPAFPDGLQDADHPLEVRARTYLHVNCSGCHRPAGPTPSDMDLRFVTPVSAMGVCNAPPRSGDLGIANARLIAPGDVERSLLVERMSRRDIHAMPPLASTVADAEGVGLVAAWVLGMSSTCNNGAACH